MNSDFTFLSFLNTSKKKELFLVYSDINEFHIDINSIFYKANFSIPFLKYTFHSL